MTAYSCKDSSLKNSSTSALLTDLYQLTMAQGYFHNSKLDTQGCFHIVFRDYPFNGGYAIACGIAQISEFVSNFKFELDQIEYLRKVKCTNGDKMFADDFLEYLLDLKLSVDIDSVPEGTVVFPNEPVVRVTGPMLDCQLIETPILNAFNFQTLVATKAARVCYSAQCPVAEFGLRRAQGPEGGVWASRAACIGGCSSTSNVEAGMRFGLPVSGTHSHSWVQSFDDELDAFRAYAKEFPNNCVLLVDTYDVEKGIDNAITVGLEMKNRGEQLSAIRIDSGDLSWISNLARKKLDAAGLNDTGVVLSNDLDEYSIKSIAAEGGMFTALGVGTKLATAYDQPALGGVFKLAAYKDNKDSQWTPKIKISESRAKTTVPGVLNVRRYMDQNGKLSGDMIFDINDGVDEYETIVDPFDNFRRKELGSYTGRYNNTFIELLQPLVKNGKSVINDFDYKIAKECAQEGLKQLDETQKRTLNPHTYPVGLEHSLNAKRNKMVASIRGIHEQ